MVYPVPKQLFRSVLLAALLITACSVGRAQDSSAAASLPGNGQYAWESIESPENTDFWDALLPPGQALFFDTSLPRYRFDQLYGQASSAEAEHAAEKPVGPSVSVTVREDGTFEYNVDEVQGNGGGTGEPQDQEACGGS